MVQRLNWGCGLCAAPGWTNSDVTAAPGIEIVRDIRLGLPINDAVFDYIVSIHSLPEIPYLDMDLVLGELWRVLKPGGWIRLSLPDMNRAIQAYLNNDPSYFLIGDDVVRSLAGKLVVQLTWFGRSRMMFTADFMAEMLARNRFRNITQVLFRQTVTPHAEIVELDNREPESIFIEAHKPAF
jgi:ubiquinone/menaquinone biosynthesis C-methylase UbiE